MKVFWMELKHDALAFLICTVLALGVCAMLLFTYLQQPNNLFRAVHALVPGSVLQALGVIDADSFGQTECFLSVLYVPLNVLACLYAMFGASSALGREFSASGAVFLFSGVRSRNNIAAHKFAAVLLYLALHIAAVYGGIYGWFYMFDPVGLHPYTLLLFALGSLFTAFVFSCFGFLLSVLFASSAARTFFGAAVLAAAAALQLVPAQYTALQELRKVSPFYSFNPGRYITEGIGMQKFVLFAVAAVVILLFGFVILSVRDISIKQKQVL